MDKTRAAFSLSLIILLAIALRALPLIYGQFSMPQSVITIISIQQTIMHGYHFSILSGLFSGLNPLSNTISYTISPNLLSGFGPRHFAFTEPGVVIFFMPFYWLFGRFLGIFGTMYAVKILFIIMGAIGVYLFTLELTENKTAGVIATFLYAISTISISIEEFTVWKGESYIPTLTIISLLLLLYAVKESSRKRKIIYGILSVLLIAICPFIWNGGLYSLMIYALIILLFALNNKLKSPKKIVLLVFGVAILFWPLYIASGYYASQGLLAGPFISNNTFNLTSINGFFPVFIPTIAQIQPQINWQITPIYQIFLSYPSLSLKMPFILWELSGFLSTTFLAIFAMYLLLKERREKHVENAYLALIALIIISAPFAMAWNYLSCLFYLPIIILAGAAIPSILKNRWLCVLFCIVLLLSTTFTVLVLVTTYTYPELTPQYKAACLWLQGNTPKNATVVSDEYGGASVEYWGNRTSYIDTDTADNSTNVMNVTDFFFARAYNFTFLRQIRPDYLLLQNNSIKYIAAVSGLPTTNPINGTNIALLENSTSITGSNITILKVYSENGIAIFKINYGT